MVYMLTLGVYYILMVNVTIYSSTMDPMGTELTSESDIVTSTHSWN